MAKQTQTQAPVQHNRRASDKAAADANARLVKLLESTIELKVTNELKALRVEQLSGDGLAKAVHNAVHNGVTDVVTGTAQPTSPPAGQTERRAQPVVTGPGTAGPRGAKVKAVWDALDGLGKDATLEDVRKLAARKRWNDNTAKTQFYRWKAARGYTK